MIGQYFSPGTKEMKFNPKFEQLFTPEVGYNHLKSTMM